MFEVFPVMRQLHELLWYLTEALTLRPARPLHGELARRAGEDRTPHPGSARRARRSWTWRRTGETSTSCCCARANSCGPRSGHEKKDRRGADLIGANLRGADLRGANLRGAYLIGADLQGRRPEDGRPDRGRPAGRRPAAAPTSPTASSSPSPSSTRPRATPTPGCRRRSPAPRTGKPSDALAAQLAPLGAHFAERDLDAMDPAVCPPSDDSFEILKHALPLPNDLGYGQRGEADEGVSGEKTYGGRSP